jgi:hypothetical protein
MPMEIGMDAPILQLKAISNSKNEVARNFIKNNVFDGENCRSPLTPHALLVILLKNTAAVSEEHRG